MIHGLFYALDNTIVVGLLYGATTLAELNLVGATYTVLLFIACMYDWIGSLCVAIVLSTVQRKMATANKNTTRSMSMFKLAAAACTVTVALANAIHMIRTISTTTAASVSLLQSLSFPTIEASHTWVEAVDNICAVWLRLVYSLWNKMLASGTAPRDHTYEPSLGIRWYLDAQMIPEYRSYFDTLFIIQPVMSACLLRQHVAQENPTIAAHLAITIAMLFRRNLCMVDVICGAILLLQHEQIVQRMRHVPLIGAGIAVPLVVSPLMFMLWVDKGTGNANYCFFQGLCLWLFCALGISEFCVAVMRK